MAPKFISIIIPNYNSSRTIGKCLEAACSLRYDSYEVVVVDDCSEDGSVEIIKKFPCRLIRLERHAGASRARNAGAASSQGQLLFFIDADCIVIENILPIIEKAISNRQGKVIIGGTYTEVPFDLDFFSRFQSVFINYSETKKGDNPDYIATHAMILRAEDFREAGGFREDFLPILEDVEFSHRMRKSGYKLVMNREIQVQHIFHFTFLKSFRNAMRKSMYWTMYSIQNKDLFADSGTASSELKANVFLSVSMLLLLAFGVAFGKAVVLGLAGFIFLIDLCISRKLIRAFYKAGGRLFTFAATFYYTMIYPLAISLGAAGGVLKYLWGRLVKGNSQV